MVEGALRLDADATSSRPLTLDASLTLRALAIAVMMIVAFWAARETFARGGIRLVLRSICWAGLAVSLVAIATRYATPHLIYGIWPTADGRTPVYGPFVNRNHMGSWLVLAIPLATGYLAARIVRRHSTIDSLDATSIWIGGAVCAMLAALVVSTSRSATVGLAAAGLVGAGIAMNRHGARSRKWLIGAIVAAAIVFVSIPVSSQLLAKFDHLKNNATGGRLPIWIETLPIVHDFALAGTGLGTYRMTMLVYQRTEREVLYNQAHDEYLQLAAESGLLVGIPLLLACIAFIAVLVARLRADSSNSFWIRAGAASSVAGIMVQSIWEVGLRMPANGLLFAVVCAIAVHGSAATAGSADTPVAPRNDRERERGRPHGKRDP